MGEGRVLRFPRKNRGDLAFRVTMIPTVMDGEPYSYPCIGLYEKETGIQITADTGLEMYLRNFVTKKGAAASRMRKIAYAVVSFLNFLLTRSEIDGIQDATLATLHDFLAWYKTVGDGGRSRDPSSWKEGAEFVFSFLENYRTYNCGLVPFAYDGKALRIADENARSGYVRPGLNVRPPERYSRKNRILLYGYLDLLKRCARRYDPMLVLAIDVGCYGGAREGETVVLSPGRIRVMDGPFGSVDGIEMDLTRDAEFWDPYALTDCGSVKRPRKQRIYPDFIPTFRKDLNEHLLLRRDVMAKKGKDSEDPNGPLFVNEGGNPLTAQMFSERLKRLFTDHFLPELEQYCLETGCYDENKSYIDAYKAEYPGAHMRRYWFTMYLKTKARLDDEEIRIWRGDRSAVSFQHYLSLNYDLFEDFSKSAFYYQASILEAIDREDGRIV